MLTEREEQYLTKLAALARQKCKEEYGMEIKGEIKIDISKSLAENRLSILKAVKDEKDPVYELTCRANLAIEDYIRIYPEQWVWIQRRWRM